MSDSNSGGKLGLGFQRVFLLITFWLLTCFFGPSHTVNADTGGVSNASEASKTLDALDHIEVYLHTIDKGDLVYNNFGHTALRLINRKSGTDLVYNWGIFSFGDPLFFMVDFYKGDLYYQLGVYPYHLAARQYRAEQRTVWQDKLNLTPQQKKRLLERLDWNNKPENRKYLYHYFADNCSTRPRDYIDEALGGLLKYALFNNKTEKTYRDYIRSAYSLNPEIKIILELGLNSEVDRQITAWEAMFHPLELRDALKAYGQNLISESSVLFRFDPPEPIFADDFYAFSVVGLAFLLPGIAFIGFGIKKASNLALNAPESLFWTQIGFRIIGFFGTFFYIIAGILGLLIPFSSFFSNHEILYHNYNLLLFLPLDFLLVGSAFTLLVKARPMHVSARAYVFIKRYIQAHLIITMGLALSWALDLVKQDVSQIVIHVLPVYVGLLSLSLQFGYRQTSSHNLKDR
jgi:hypothetical protein